MAAVYQEPKNKCSDSIREHSISGNVSDAVKHTIASGISDHIGGYSESIGKRIRILSIYVQENAEDVEKLESKVICELDVAEGPHMLFDYTTGSYMSAHRRYD